MSAKKSRPNKLARIGEALMGRWGYVLVVIIAAAIVVPIFLGLSQWSGEEVSRLKPNEEYQFLARPGVDIQKVSGWFITVEDGGGLEIGTWSNGMISLQYHPGSEEYITVGKNAFGGIVKFVLHLHESRPH